jgi:hypothetical protein
MGTTQNRSSASVPLVEAKEESIGAAARHWRSFSVRSAASALGAFLGGKIRSLGAPMKTSTLWVRNSTALSPSRTTVLRISSRAVPGTAGSQALTQPQAPGPRHYAGRSTPRKCPGHFDAPVILKAARWPRAMSAASDSRTARWTKASFPSRKPPPRSAPPLSPTARPHSSKPTNLVCWSNQPRIRLADGHDRQFALSMSGIRTLPHEIEAVYMKIQPQPGQ